ncbi:MAG: D-alanyl-D-alanine carboxypeptidase/D-alanyl-D-alanine-endopeptidase [Bacteroidetes bacterium]|nr:D-alanyl-D-alanine carboxypeptidase/D-alanyl-D-alanine-endopeptidase [Bacteroidota bacterium]
MIKRSLIIFLFLLQIIFSYSQSISKLSIEIEKLKSDEALKHAVWSICVMPVKKDTILAEYNSTISLVPASTLKIVTTGAALSMLGGDFKFETKLQYDGVFDSISGIIKGNLYIVGGGDPTLESEYFKDKKDSLSTTDKWAELLKKKGIKKIEGAIIGDASIFDDNMIPSQWIWADIGNYFGAGASGLSYHDNKYTLYLKSAAVGSKTVITKTTPYIDGLQTVNNVISGGNNDNAFIYGAPYSYYREIQGTIPANKNNYEVEGSIPDPALFCAQSLEISLKKIGIKITKKPTTTRALREADEYFFSNKHTLYKHNSPTLNEIIYWTNFKSNNLYAEHLLKYIAYKKDGIGRENEGTEIITAFWKNKGVDVNGFFMNDGCGLSRSNVITTKTEAQILRLMAKDKNFKAYYNSFPIAGKIGPLDNFCEGTSAKDNLCAKSGYITRARGYAGYVKNKKGEMLCFSLLANNYDCTPPEMKKKLEKLMIAIAEME